MGHASPPVYFDHNSTTPLDPRVREAMLPWLGERWGNPSSAHRGGQAAADAVETARERVAALLGAAAAEIVFTASGTEGNNAVLASALATAPAGARLVLSAFEHPSIGRAADAWAAPRGIEVVRVAPRPDGVIDAGQFVAALDERTVLAALMLAQNEFGTLQPVTEVAGACRARGIPLLCDAVQAVGKIPVDVGGLGVDYLTLGGHKFGAPLGAAAIWIRTGAPFEPLLVGGAQERRRRASTANVPALVGLGEACALAAAELPARGQRLARLRDRFETGLANALPDAIVQGAAAERVPHTSHVRFPGTVGVDLAIRLDLAGFLVSAGPACGSGTVEPSPAMAALGLPRAEAISALRISFGEGNDEAQVDRLLAVLPDAVEAVRAATLRAVG